MKLYLVDDYKIFTYLLPNKVEDAFLINYVHYSGEEETITFMADNNNWVIESTPDITFFKDINKIDKEIVQNDSIYSIQFSDLTDKVFLYCVDEHQTFFDYDLSTRMELTIGRSGPCEILYDNVNVGSPELKIYKQNNLWVLEDNGFEPTRVYVNNYRVRKTILNMGDVIFTNGLKIIWMDTFIRFNNFSGKVMTNLTQYQSYSDGTEEINKYTPVKDTEKSVVLYNDNQVFFHTPRLKEAIEEKEIFIERPPQIVEGDKMPAILSVGSTAVMGFSSLFTGMVTVSRVTSGKVALVDASAEIVLCVTMVLGTMVLPIIISNYSKRLTNKREAHRKKTYRDYLDKVRNEVNEEIQKETKILFDNYFNQDQLKEFITNNSNKLWSREISDSDFLNVRLGIGNQKAAIKLSTNKLAYDIDKDVLNTEAQELSEQKWILEQVPITISLTKNNVLPFIISYDYTYKKQFIDFLLLQFISYYSGNDLKIVVFTTEDNSNQWKFLKYLPHCHNETRKFRFYSENEDEAKQLSNYLEKIYQSRWDFMNQKNGDEDGEKFEDKQKSGENNLDEAYKNFDQYYLIITDNYVASKRLGIFQKILNHPYNAGFSMMMIEPTMQNVPSKCDNIVQISNEACGIINKNINENDEQNSFKPDLLYDDIKNYANVIANIPLAIESTAGKLPKSFAFLEMYKVGKIEQLNILNRWAKNDPTNSIAAPIGVHEDGKIFELDLHEKASGPHGLIAGSTGSGKSEFIITFILSMAVNYHPYEVQFVLIDYKGGGLAGAFENKESGIKLPHLAGTITNLDVSEMNRTLVSINSELKRRQRMFNEARDSLNESTIDIYKYQKYYREGKVKEPMSHLFIISDEFAELKSQQPDFMEALVSTARIGRSLGVHLILATQKPAGVVDDQIWSNSRFKVCLKVATAEDSRELLRRPEAAEIKETGRFYLQVGFNESFELGQSAWAGAKYNPTDHIIKNIDDSIDLVNNVGEVINSINDIKEESQENHGEQLTNIVQTLYNIAKREKIDCRSMWLPSLPATLYISNLLKKYNYKAEKYNICPLVGEYDDPEKQFQGQFSIDLSNGGNLLIYGLAGSGKENLIMTILYSIFLYHTSDEVNTYILDFGAEIIKNLKDMPQVGDVALIDDNDKIKSLIVMLEREQIRRKELFSEYGGSYNDYIKNSGKKLPTILVVLNGWDAFAESYSDYVDIIAHILRESSKYGIIFITSIVASNSMIGITQQYFTNKITLQMSDSFDYKYILDARDGLIPKKEYSRGLCVIDDCAYEFQGAYIYYKDKINDAIKSAAETLSKSQKKAPKIPVIPSVVTADTIAPYITNLSSVPMGINIKDANVFSLDLMKNKITQIIGNYIINEKNFLNELVKVLSLVQESKLRIIDFAGAIDDPSEIDDYMGDEFTKSIKSITIKEKEETKNIIYLIIGIGRIYDKVLDEGIEYLFKIFDNVDAYKKSSFIIIDNYSAFRKTMDEEWYKKQVNKNVGVWVGTDIESQVAISYDKLTKGEINEDFNGIVYCSTDNENVVLRGIGTIPQEDD